MKKDILHMSTSLYLDESQNIITYTMILTPELMHKSRGNARVPQNKSRGNARVPQNNQN
jgi:hypothetical protein